MVHCRLNFFNFFKVNRFFLINYIKRDYTLIIEHVDNYNTINLITEYNTNIFFNKKSPVKNIILCKKLISSKYTNILSF